MIKNPNKLLKRTKTVCSFFAKNRKKTSQPFQPLSKALVVRTKSNNINLSFSAKLMVLSLVQSLVWQWKCHQIITSSLLNPVFAFLYYRLKQLQFLRLKVHGLVCSAEALIASSACPVNMVTYCKVSAFNNQQLTRQSKGLKTVGRARTSLFQPTIFSLLLGRYMLLKISSLKCRFSVF